MNDKGRMSAEEIERLVQEAEKYKSEDDANRARIEAKNAMENYCFSVKSSINDEKIADKISEEDKTKIMDAISKAQSWLDSNQSVEKEEFEEKQKELEAVVTPVLQAMGAGAGGMPGGMPDMSGMGGAGGMPDMSGMGGAGGAPEADDGPKIEEID